MRLARFVTVAALLALPAAPSISRAQQPDQPARQPAAYESDPRFLATMADGKQQRADEKYTNAADAFKKAVKLSDGQCRRCLNDLYAVQMEARSFKDAITTANQLIALAETPREKSNAENRLGDAILHQAGDKPKPAQLDAAQIAFAAAVADAPRNLAARYNDGCVLARQGKMDEAKEQFANCAANASPTDPTRIRAQHFADNPALALNKMAPAFELTALDGTRVNLDSIGKVILIDFWATWCGPCNAALPEIKKIAKEFAGQPLVILSISRDDDEHAWRAFIDKNQMTWLQFRDRNDRLTRLFAVEGIPHYFTIDSDGVLTSEMMGSDSDVEGKLKKLVKKARLAAPAPVAAQQTTAGGTGN